MPGQEYKGITLLHRYQALHPCTQKAFMQALHHLSLYCLLLAKCQVYLSKHRVFPTDGDEGPCTSRNLFIPLSPSGKIPPPPPPPVDSLHSPPNFCSPLPPKINFPPGWFHTLYAHVILNLILIDVQYSQKAVFSFKITPPQVPST